MADCSRLLTYFRGCYQADHARGGLRDLFDRSIRHLSFLEGTERLVSGKAQWDHLRFDAARPLAVEAKLYEREKSLVYAVLPMVGCWTPQGGGKSRPRCAPLVLYPARLRQVDEMITAEVDLAAGELNVPVLQDLLAAQSLVGGPPGEESPTEDRLQRLVDEMPEAPLDAAKLASLRKLLAEVLPSLDTSAFDQFPQLLSEREVRRQLRDVAGTTGSYTCLPAAALALVPNSPRTRGVLYELEQMATAERLSSPVRLVLGESPGAEPHAAAPLAPVPAVLSRAQQAVLGSAARHPLSMVVGPPGTGKTFTIAAVALEHIARGESVLVACRHDAAVDVVAGMIDRLLGANHCVIRGGRPEKVRELKDFLEDLLHGIRRQMILGNKAQQDGSADDEVYALTAERQALEQALADRVAAELRWGELTHLEASGLVSRWLRAGERWLLERRLAGEAELWREGQAYDHALDQFNQRARELLVRRIDQRVGESLREHRRDLTKFLQSIRTRSSLKQSRLFAEVDLRRLFGTFPVWLTTVADVAELVPLECELFDVVIFDEATQCDIASSLPVLQRGRRAVVVGDPHQLRHLSFVSDQQLSQLADEHDLLEEQQPRYHYRDKCLLDLVSDSIGSQSEVHFLNEHFRSEPPIIAFSNAEFYEGALSVMRRRPTTSAAPCLLLHRVSGGKHQDGTNPTEAAALIDHVSQLARQQADWPAGECESLGVLSPFRDQVDHIAAQLEQRLSLAALERHHVRVGTAHAFQGDERDVMLLSLVVDGDSHAAATQFLSKADVLNVSITRARLRQHVFVSLDASELPVDSLVRNYLESIPREAVAASGPVAPVDEILRQVVAALEQRGAIMWPRYEVAGVILDLVVERDGRLLGVDLIGFPGEVGAAVDLERYRILRRAGLPVFLLGYRRWHANRDACLDALLERLTGAEASARQ